MAGGNGPLWPGPVTMNEDDPKKGYIYLFLTMKEMKVKKVLFGKNTSPNTTFNKGKMFMEYEILVTGKVTDKETEYEYKKKLPEKINPELCSYKLQNDQIILTVCKGENVSWAQHAKYLTKRD